MEPVDVPGLRGHHPRSSHAPRRKRTPTTTPAASAFSRESKEHGRTKPDNRPKRLLLLRERLGVTQNELARLCHVKMTLVRDAELGKKCVDSGYMDYLLTIAADLVHSRNRLPPKHKWSST